MQKTVSRRFFLGAAFAGCLVGERATAGSLTASSLTPSVSEFAISIPGLSPAFHHYRVGFLSDLHLSRFILDEEIDQVVSMLNQLKPDLVVLGGDYSWIPDTPFPSSLFPYRNPYLSSLPDGALAEELPRRLATILRQLSPPDGVIAVLGNHEWWLNPRFTRNAFGSQKLTLLENSQQTILRGSEKLVFFGVDDYLNGTPRLPRHPLPQGSVLISHNPDLVWRTVIGKRPDFGLALCGHTHGGQIRLPGAGPLLLGIRHRELGEGLTRWGEQQVFTTRGIGMVFAPVRVNCPPEIALLSLVKA